MGEESMQGTRRVRIITTPTPPPTRTKKKSADINVARMQHSTMCSRDIWNVSQFAVAFVYSLVVGAKLTFASCIHLHSLTFHSQSHVCNSCVFSQFSHLGDRKTPILTIKKTRTRTFKYGLTEELGKGNITGDKLE
jgi:hypothetical protein